ncbi:MAG: AbrB/MazE/SpoVT family DNA-binding domain-containing protein [Methyloceanibacter sp.]
MAAIVSGKGQVVIPKAVREALGIQPGSRVEFEVAGGEARLKVIRRKNKRLDEVVGCLGYTGPAIPVEQLSGVEAARRLAKQGKL